MLDGDSSAPDLSAQELSHEICTTMPSESLPYDPETLVMLRGGWNTWILSMALLIRDPHKLDLFEGYSVAQL